MSFADDVLTKVKKEVLEKLENGNSKFAIYPYGNHGVRVANMLKECFDIEAEYIVDNTLFKYNKRIISFDKFKKLYTNDVYVILTVENLEVNEEMYNALQEFVKEDNIINIITISNKIIEEQIDFIKVKEGFVLDNILLKERQEIDNYITNEKIKVRFMYPRPNVWNSVKTICEAFEKSERYDVLVVINSESEEKQMKLYRHSYIQNDEYDVEYDKPDIFIIPYTGWSKEKLIQLRRNTKLVIAASMCVSNFLLDIEGCCDYFDRVYQYCEPDYFLFDSGIYQELSEYGYMKDKLVEIGNAKYDGIYEACKDKVYPLEWEKLKGKKTILWITTHGIYPYRKDYFTTFDLYARFIFKYMENNNDLALIFRPHSVLIDELISLGIWKDKDVNRLINYCDSASNVVFDGSDSYDSAFSVSDAIIADEMSGVMYSGLPTMKPICAMYRFDGYSRPNKDKILDSCYAATNIDELLDYFEMIRVGKDPMYDRRKEASKKYVKNFDGKNGERIKEFIEKKYFERNQ